jgi:GAF domain-containing protein
MAIVSAIGRSLAETLDAVQIYSRLAEALASLLPDVAAIFVSRFDPERELILPVYGVVEGQVIDVSDLPALPLAPAGQGTQSAVIRTRRPLIVEDLPGKIRRGVYVLGEGDSRRPQSALFVPLLAKGEILGVFQVQSYLPNRFKTEDAELLAIVGNTAAIAMQNADIFEETRRRVQRLDALHTIDKAITTISTWISLSR